ncbi:3-hydroxyacyl-CoA dehydrogenase (plasmid) [Streptomyces sp. NBC_01717]|uniref:3-hydroxyacyl-CoA dehydrogenase n=1 Tax=Streptomyces sp. NBC_01717 TaxID=2975918 RepID=UPI002E2EEB24|nr:3-hydroxyacyl-CoA dehydrogenase [Streptomyces sp. NBC_01717]
MSQIDRVTVLGAGVLGSQIAWHSAFKGKTVVVYDLDAEPLDRCRAAHEQYASIYLGQLGARPEDIAATRGRLTYTNDLGSAVAAADLVIEAVPEIPEVKTDVYEKISGLLADHTLVVTNSSTLLPSDFAAATGRPEKFCALHFANLIWSMNVVEVMAHPGTAADTLTQVTEYAIEIGMVPVPVQKEQNGYVLNTWLVPLLNAAQTLVTNGVSIPEDVDRTFLIANRGCAIGPMGMVDVIGMKTVFDVLASWGTRSGDQQMLDNAAYIKKVFLDEGKLGMHSGQGYYAYPDPVYARPDFLAAPDKSAVPGIVERATLS